MARINTSTLRRRNDTQAFTIVFAYPALSAFLWTCPTVVGIVAPTRAADWTTAGVKGGIPSAHWTQCGSTIAAYSGTAATINKAIAACGNDQYVQLGAGTFTLSTGIRIAKSNIVLRGMGADQTFLVMGSGATIPYCGVGGKATMGICNGVYPPNSANWTAGYSQGTTQITLDSTTGISVGTVITLDQSDDPSDGWPATGDIYVCQVASASCSTQGRGGNGADSGRAQTEFHEVTSINGSTITITPPIFSVNFRSSQSPGAYWQPSLTNIVTSSGIENLSLDWGAASTSGVAALYMVDTKDSWIKGVRLVNTAAPTTYVDGIFFWRAFRNTLQDSYIYGPASQAIASYASTMLNSGSILIQNNIYHGGGDSIIIQGPRSNSVIGYNFFVGTSTLNTQCRSTVLEI